jgi:hypothetical protein
LTSHTFIIPLVEATLCFVIVTLLRIAIVYLSPRLGAILIGTPILIFPLLAMQAWLGPTPNQTQTLGSMASVASITLGLWSMRLPFNFTARAVVVTMAIVWVFILLALYLFKVPATVVASAIVVNAAFVLTKFRGQKATRRPSAAKLSEGAVPTAIFLLTFFAATQVVREFILGVVAMFPVALLATLNFARRVCNLEDFRAFAAYAQGAITATAVFVIAVYFTIVEMPIAVSLLVSLVASIATSILVSLIWRPGSNGVGGQLR